MEIKVEKIHKPNEEQIKKWLREEVTIFLLESLAKKINEFDTVRNLTIDNHIDKLAEKKAIEIIESIFFDVYKELPELQSKVADKEFNIVNYIKEFQSSEY